jgi:hypothetical protein
MIKEDQGSRLQFHCITLHPCAPQLETRCVPWAQIAIPAWQKRDTREVGSKSTFVRSSRKIL